jgi:hypothetical protein
MKISIHSLKALSNFKDLADEQKCKNSVILPQQKTAVEGILSSRVGCLNISRSRYNIGNLLCNSDHLKPLVIPILRKDEKNSTAHKEPPLRPILEYNSQNIQGEYKKTYIREVAGKKWVDASLADWPENDYRLFVGNLSKDVTDEILAQHFAHYPSFTKARVIRDKYTKGPKGYGFVSFLDVVDFSRALKEMEWTYIFNRPCKLCKSTWYARTTTISETSQVSKTKKLEFKVLNLKSKQKLLHKRNKKHHIGGVPNLSFPLTRE